VRAAGFRACDSPGSATFAGPLAGGRALRHTGQSYAGGL
jgi:hypothetical protein